MNERRPKAVLGAGYFAGRRVALAKPRTFMNNSGEAIEYLLARFGGGSSNLLVIYDEMALLPGRIRLRAAGSDAGAQWHPLHHPGGGRNRVSPGCASASALRRRESLAHEYVLGKFQDEEADAIAGAVERAAAAVRCVLEENIDAAMNRFNQDPSKQAEEQPPQAS